jgi:DNA-directed RNA polymerase specialized sigma subunit
VTLSTPITTVALDDTVLDQLAAQVRANPPLTDDAVATTLAAARRNPGGPASEALVAHHLGVALAAALALHAEGDDVAELYQEGCLALVAAVADYVAGGGPPTEMRAAVREAVEAHIRSAQDAERRRREEQEAFVRDTRTLDLVEVALRHQFGRPATTAELAEVLKWEPRRVELVSELLEDARRLHDETLIPFLDDETL